VVGSVIETLSRGVLGARVPGVESASPQFVGWSLTIGWGLAGSTPATPPSPALIGSMANTASPMRNRFAAGPTDSTIPAVSEGYKGDRHQIWVKCTICVNSIPG
jgi:hypothetical protein